MYKERFDCTVQLDNKQTNICEKHVHVKCVQKFANKSPHICRKAND